MVLFYYNHFWIKSQKRSENLQNATRLLKETVAQPPKSDLQKWNKVLTQKKEEPTSKTNTVPSFPGTRDGERTWHSK